MTATIDKLYTILESKDATQADAAFELDDGTTANVGIAIDAPVLVKNRGSTIECINVNAISCSGCNVVVSVSEDGLKERVEHNSLIECE